MELHERFEGGKAQCIKHFPCPKNFASVSATWHLARSLTHVLCFSPSVPGMFKRALFEVASSRISEDT